MAADVGVQYRTMPVGAVVDVDERRLFQILVNGLRCVFMHSCVYECVSVSS
jgi:hypothetical protein